MRLLFVSSLLTLSLHSACGKEADAPEAQKAQPDLAPEAPKAQPDPAPAPAPAPALAPAPAPTPDLAPAPSPAAPAQPGWWAPLFEKGKVTNWDIAETARVTEMTDDGEPGKTTTKNLNGKLTCTVKDVQPSTLKAEDGQGPAVLESVVTCEGYAFDHGTSAGPDGTWVSDGRTLWQRYTNVDELRFESEPKVRDDKSEEEEVKVVANPDGTWCHELTLLLGDGGAEEACYDKARGPYLYTSVGGSALIDSEVTARLAP